MNGGHEKANSKTRSRKTLRHKSALSPKKDGLAQTDKLWLKSQGSSDERKPARPTGRSYQNVDF